MMHLGRKIFTLVVWSQCLVQQRNLLVSAQTNSPGSGSAPFTLEEMGLDLDKIKAEIESDVTAKLADSASKGLKTPLI